MKKILVSMLFMACATFVYAGVLLAEEKTDVFEQKNELMLELSEKSKLCFGNAETKREAIRCAKERDKFWQEKMSIPGTETEDKMRQMEWTPKVKSELVSSFDKEIRYFRIVKKCYPVSSTAEEYEKCLVKHGLPIEHEEAW